MTSDGMSAGCKKWVKWKIINFRILSKIQPDRSDCEPLGLDEFLIFSNWMRNPLKFHHITGNSLSYG